MTNTLYTGTLYFRKSPRGKLVAALLTVRATSELNAWAKMRRQIEEKNPYSWVHPKYVIINTEEDV